MMSALPRPGCLTPSIFWSSSDLGDLLRQVAEHGQVRPEDFYFNRLGDAVKVVDLVADQRRDFSIGLGHFALKLHLQFILNIFVISPLPGGLQGHFDVALEGFGGVDAVFRAVRRKKPATSGVSSKILSIRRATLSVCASDVPGGNR